MPGAGAGRRVVLRSTEQKRTILDWGQGRDRWPRLWSLRIGAEASTWGWVRAQDGRWTRGTCGGCIPTKHTTESPIPASQARKQRQERWRDLQMAELRLNPGFLEPRAGQKQQRIPEPQRPRNPDGGPMATMWVSDRGDTLAPARLQDHSTHMEREGRVSQEGRRFGGTWALEDSEWAFCTAHLWPVLQQWALEADEPRSPSHCGSTVWSVKWD